jgi:hypothetical protein
VHTALQEGRRRRLQRELATSHYIETLIGPGMMEDARPTDHYSRSLFVIEADWTPTVTFEAKWYTEAEVICRTWTNKHWKQLVVKGRGGVEYPPIIKLRLAHRNEIDAYAAENAEFEDQDGTRIVYLRQLGSPAD